MTRRAYQYLRGQKIKGFFSLIDDCGAPGLRLGTSALLQVAGIEKMRPNVLLMGYKNDWRTCDRDDLVQYFGAIQYNFFANIFFYFLKTKPVSFQR